jgi:hypothetical protein
MATEDRGVERSRRRDGAVHSETAARSLDKLRQIPARPKRVHHCGEAEALKKWLTSYGKWKNIAIRIANGRTRSAAMIKNLVTHPTAKLRGLGFIVTHESDVDFLPDVLFGCGRPPQDELQVILDQFRSQKNPKRRQKSFGFVIYASSNERLPRPIGLDQNEALFQLECAQICSHAMRSDCNSFSEPFPRHACSRELH